MDKRRNHIIFWVGYFVYYYSVITVFYDKVTLPLSVNIGKVCFGTLILFYILTSKVFPYTLPSKKYFKLFFFVLILLLSLSFINYIVSVILNVFFPQVFSILSFAKNFSWALRTLDGAFAFALTFWLSKEIISNAKHERVLEQQQSLLRNNIANAELLALKNQINPHFLYNMLNFFYAQFLPYSAKTSKAILQLSDMMRYMIRDTKIEGKVLLEEEINYLKSYVELENLNKKSGKIIMDVSGSLGFRRVQPLIFQNIIEHSCLFGNNIFLQIFISDNQVVFSSNYIKKDEISLELIIGNVDTIKQKISNTTECNISFYQHSSEHHFQVSLKS